MPGIGGRGCYPPHPPVRILFYQKDKRQSLGNLKQSNALLDIGEPGRENSLQCLRARCKRLRSPFCIPFCNYLENYDLQTSIRPKIVSDGICSQKTKSWVTPKTREHYTCAQNSAQIVKRTVCPLLVLDFNASCKVSTDFSKTPQTHIS
jgi:hypothetical protein